jgi:hypothetical protein
MKRKIQGLRAKAKYQENKAIDDHNLQFIQTLLDQDKLRKNVFDKLFTETGNLDHTQLFNEYSKQMRKRGKTIPPKPEESMEEITQNLAKERTEQTGISYNFGYRNKYPIAFKSPWKIVKNREPIKNKITISFPLKENLKKYALKQIAPRHTFVEDIVYFEVNLEYSIAFLILINQNTRQAYAEPLNIIPDGADDNGNIILTKNEKSVNAYIPALKSIIRSNNLKIKFLKGDNEKAFNSSKLYGGYVQKFYSENGIIFIPTPLSFGHANHSSLSIIDRLIRTIRDAQYNMDEKYITPELMNEIIWQYNNTPHKTLSKIFGKLTSPNDMTKNMEIYMIRQLKQKNFNIMNQFGFDLAPGTKVLVYHSKDPLKKRRSLVKPHIYEIIEFKNGLYKIRGGNGKINYNSRYLLRNVY